ncbi:MAG: hypothetical protein GY772_31410, partial [bacterium]|nr:hypothetical protein [bacterium]
MTAMGANSQALQEFRELENDRQRKLEAIWRRKALARALPEQVDLRGKRVFVDDAAHAACGLPQQWREAIAGPGLVEGKERTAANVFVVLNPAAPGDRNK